MESKFPFQKWLNNFSGSKDLIGLKIAEGTRDFFLEQFDSAKWEDEETEEWDPLAPGTLSYKSRMGYGNKPLINTHKLRDSLVNSIKSSKFDEILLVVDTNYASFHNDGTDTIPKRQFVGDSYELRKVWKRIINEEVNKIVR